MAWVGTLVEVGKREERREDHCGARCRLGLAAHRAAVELMGSLGLCVWA